MHKRVFESAILTHKPVFRTWSSSSVCDTDKHFFDGPFCSKITQPPIPNFDTTTCYSHFLKSSKSVSKQLFVALMNLFGGKYNCASLWLMLMPRGKRDSKVSTEEATSVLTLMCPQLDESHRSRRIAYIKRLTSPIRVKRVVNHNKPIF